MRLKYLGHISLVCLITLTFLLQGCAPAIIAGSAAGAATIASDARTTGSIIEDQAIEFRLAGLLQSDPEMTERTNINVTSYNNIVLLTGEAPTEALKEKASVYAQRDPKIKRIYNEIRIAEPLPFKARNFDTWLTTKIKTKLLTTKGIPSLNVKVVTSNTTVFLLGIISRRDADAITQVVARIQGVTRIVKAFEYTD